MKFNEEYVMSTEKYVFVKKCLQMDLNSVFAYDILIYSRTVGTFFRFVLNNWIITIWKSGEHLRVTYGNMGQLFRP